MTLPTSTTGVSALDRLLFSGSPSLFVLKVFPIRATTPTLLGIVLPNQDGVDDSTSVNLERMSILGYDRLANAIGEQDQWYPMAIGSCMPEVLQGLETRINRGLQYLSKVRYSAAVWNMGHTLLTNHEFIKNKTIPSLNEIVLCPDLSKLTESTA